MYKVITVINNHFVQHCLQKIDSDLVVHSGHYKHECSDQLPEKISVKILAEFLTENISNEGLVMTGIQKFTDLAFQDGFELFEHKNQFLINKIILTYPQNETIQHNLLRIIESSLHVIAEKKLLDSESLNDRQFLNATTIKNIFYIFLKYEDMADFQLLILKIFIHLSNFVSITNQLAEYNIIKYILEIFEKHSSNPTFCAYFCKALGCLCLNHKVLRSARKQNCLSYLKKCILQHQDNLFCSEMAVNAIISLCSDERQICAEELEVDVTSAILVALEQNLESANFVKSACIALAALISYLEDCAFRFLYLAPSGSNKKEIDGINLLKKAYSIHKDERDVVECICNVFKELSSYVKHFNLNYFYI
ncbi:serine threonine kinase-like domain-containing STKLD1 isoform X2 [Brachionus plicatilis]|uniref:Serine threonine kinase-like domain-containing STKLD1 isoform X2 n=1 Tax=Brachionus plicatilis TaxID=10195 RepID=A0A3M7QBQ7_BRAPC|nr:serine threonine kinase-like domain-containing STKLD1 isoform X2 [Brachionus plicatilis]